jgi:hypothetical protein
MRAGLWLGNLKKRDHFEELDIVERIILKLLFGKWDGRAWTGSSWLRIWISGGML